MMAKLFGSAGIERFHGISTKVVVLACALLLFGSAMAAHASAPPGIAWADEGSPALTLSAADSFAADFADESRGTEEAPYRICTEQDLRDFAKAVNGREPIDGAWVSTGIDADSMAGKFVSLEADIALTEPAVPIGIGSNATTSGPAAVCFSGTFLGNNHTISGWYATTATNPVFGEGSLEVAASKHTAGAYSAPFGAISAATILDVNIVLKPGVSYAAANIGGLAAFVGKGKSTIEHCSVVGDVVAKADHAGGFVGSYCTDYGSVGTAQLTITNCFHDGAVTSSGAAAGGFVGYIGAAGVTVSSSYQNGVVSSTKAGTQYFPNENYWGAIVGSGGTYATTLSGCVASQDASLAAANATRVTQTGCVAGVADWASDAVKAALGGEEGVFDFATTAGGTVPPQFKTGAVTKVAHGITFLKGADGVTGTLPSLEPAVEGTSISIPGPGTGASALSRNGYTFAGWKRTDAAGDGAVYAAGDSFAMSDCAVEFTAQWVEKEATVLASEAQLRDFAISVNAGTVATAGNVYALGADIDLTQDFIPIGSPSRPFKGVFQGNGHVVRGLTVTDATAASSASSTAAGFFGCVEGARIEGLGVECVIDAPGCEYVGGLVGRASGSYSSTADGLARIANCFVRGSVSGGVYTGGLVGSANYMVIDGCYAQGAVTSSSAELKAAVGGLVGNLVRGASHKVAAGGFLVGNSYAACEVLATGGAITKGALIGRAYSVSDATLCAETQWPLLSNAWALASIAPVYTFGAAGSEVVGTPVEDAVSDGMRMDAASLAAAADTLGAAFKADAANALLQVNAGFPVLAWEPVLEPCRIELRVFPASAQVTLTDDETGAVLDPIEATDISEGGAPMRAYAFEAVVSHAYTAAVEAPGYTVRTEQLAASSAMQPRTIELQLATYAIRYEKAGARWAAGFVPTMTYTLESPDVELPEAADMAWDGYRFLGWYEQPDFGGAVATSVPAGSIGNKVLYAKWENIAAAENAQAREAATQALAGVDDALAAYTVSADGSDVEPGAQWVPQGAADAIRQAQTALSGLLQDEDAATEDLAAAANALNRALAELSAAAQPGTKKAPEGGNGQGSGNGGKDPDATPGKQSPDQPLVKKGTTYTVKGMSYKVTKVATAKVAGAVSLVRAKNAKSVSVPAMVKLADGRTYKITVVAAGAFKGLAKVTKVTLGKNVATVKAKAFANMKKLAQVTLGKGTKSVKKSAFSNTPKLAKLIVKSTKLKKSAVKGALSGSKLKKALAVKVPAKKKAAYKKAFAKANLKSPKKVTVK